MSRKNANSFPPVEPPATSLTVSSTTSGVSQHQSLLSTGQSVQGIPVSGVMTTSLIHAISSPSISRHVQSAPGSLLLPGQFLMAGTEATGASQRVSSTNLPVSQSVSAAETIGQRHSYQCSKCHEQLNSESDLVKHRKQCSPMLTKLLNKPGQPEPVGWTGFPGPQEPQNQPRWSSLQEPQIRQRLSSLQEPQILQRLPGYQEPLVQQRLPVQIIPFIQTPSRSRSHQGSRAQNRPLKCFFCDHYFQTSRQLTKHMRTHEGGDKPFICSVCSKAFSQEGLLKIHMRTHTGEKPFKCSVCDKAFAQKYHLTEHMRTHTDKKSFKCPVCDKAFAQKGYMNEHIKRRHSVEKPHKCQLCSKAFVSLKALRDHMLAHVRGIRSQQSASQHSGKGEETSDQPSRISPADSRAGAGLAATMGRAIAAVGEGDIPSCSHTVSPSETVIPAPVSSLPFNTSSFPTLPAVSTTQQQPAVATSPASRQIESPPEELPILSFGMGFDSPASVFSSDGNGARGRTSVLPTGLQTPVPFSETPPLRGQSGTDTVGSNIEDILGEGSSPAMSAVEPSVMPSVSQAPQSSTTGLSTHLAIEADSPTRITSVIHTRDSSVLSSTGISFDDDTGTGIGPEHIDTSIEGRSRLIIPLSPDPELNTPRHLAEPPSLADVGALSGMRSKNRTPPSRSLSPALPEGVASSDSSSGLDTLLSISTSSVQTEPLEVTATATAKRTAQHFDKVLTQTRETSSSDHDVSQEEGSSKKASPQSPSQGDYSDLPVEGAELLFHDLGDQYVKGPIHDSEPEGEASSNSGSGLDTLLSIGISTRTEPEVVTATIPAKRTAQHFDKVLTQTRETSSSDHEVSQEEGSSKKASPQSQSLGDYGDIPVEGAEPFWGDLVKQHAAEPINDSEPDSEGSRQDGGRQEQQQKTPSSPVTGKRYEAIHEQRQITATLLTVESEHQSRKSDVVAAAWQEAERLTALESDETADVVQSADLPATLSAESSSGDIIFPDTVSDVVDVPRESSASWEQKIDEPDTDSSAITQHAQSSASELLTTPATDAPETTVVRQKARLHKKTRPWWYRGFRCYDCDVGFWSYAALGFHLANAHRKGKRCLCEVCGETFRYTSYLKVHQRRHTGEKPFTCHVCEKTFRHISTLIVHKRIHTGERPFPCDICGNAFRQRSHLIAHKRRHTGEKPFRCDICGQYFRYRSYLKPHKRIHTGEQPFRCDVCGKYFRSSSSRTAHKRIHMGEKPFLCDACGKCFRSAGNLATHKRIHVGGKPYKCDVCGALFRVSLALTRHKRIHTGEKPYKCDVCGALFRLSQTLTRHRRIHTGEKPYKCDQCDAAFVQSRQLGKHKRIHTGEKPYKCDQCDAAFIQSVDLTLHTVIKHGIQPHRCDQCDAAFIHRIDLTLHKATKHGIKPYRCYVCGKAFRSRSHWGRHKQTHIEMRHIRHKSLRQYSQPSISIVPTGAVADVSESVTSGSQDLSSGVTQPRIAASVPFSGMMAASLPQSVDTKKSLSGDICQQSFSQRLVLRLHMQKHRTARTGDHGPVRREGVSRAGTTQPCKIAPKEREHIQCEICLKLFRSVDQLKTHMRVHTGERPYICPHCPKAYKQSSHLRAHMRVHTGERPYKCQFCGKAFRVSTVLKKHIRIHTGVKPYRCDICSIAYSDSSALRQHTKRHHSGIVPSQGRESMPRHERQGEQPVSRMRESMTDPSGASSPSVVRTSSMTDRSQASYTMGRVEQGRQGGYRCHKCSQSFETDVLLGVHLFEAHIEMRLSTYPGRRYEQTRTATATSITAFPAQTTLHPAPILPVTGDDGAGRGGEEMVGIDLGNPENIIISMSPPSDTAMFS